MGRRPDRSAGASACCRRAVVVVFALACVGLLAVMVATSGVSLGAPADAAAAPVGGGAADLAAAAARYSGGQAAPPGADAFRSSKRRIPKGPDPIHNRRAGKTTIAPRRRD